MGSFDSVVNMTTFRRLFLLFVILTFVYGIHGLQKSDIDGSVGPGRMFSSSSVEFLGSVNNLEDVTGCCKACRSKYPSTQLVDFHILYMYCQCSRAKNVRPATDLYSTYVAAICD